MNFKRNALIVVGVALIATMAYMIFRLNNLSQAISQLKETQSAPITADAPNAADIQQEVAQIRSDFVAESNLISVNSEGFAPKGVQVYSNQKLELVIANDDKIPHSFNVDELDIKTGPIEPGKTVSVVVDKLPTASVAYQYYSDTADDKKRGMFAGTLMILKK